MNKRHSKLAQQWLNALLALVIVGLVAWLTFTFKTEFDWTAGHRNTLTSASQKLVKALPDPIHFYAFVFAQGSSDKRQSIKDAVSRYRRVKKNVKLTFIGPSRQPQKVKKFNVTQPGQLVVEYDGRHEALDKVSEPDISEALERLAYTSKTTVAFLTGDGERSITKRNNDGYTAFASTLRNKGFNVTTLNLALKPEIPKDVSVLVIADAHNQMLPHQQSVIMQYVKNGGNLLWLTDTGTKPGLKPLSKLLGIKWLPGFVIFPNYQQFGVGSPGIYLAARYPKNPVTGKLDQITVFPLVRALTYQSGNSDGWKQQPMLETGKAAWVNTKLKGKISLEPKKGAIIGPLTIGLALSRTIKAKPASAPAKDKKDGKAVDPAPASTALKKAQIGKNANKNEKTGSSKKQRVVVVGDADFLANRFVQQVGNSSLGMNIISWLAHRNTSLSIVIPKAPDHNLYLPGWDRWFISAGYVVILPLILILFGVFRWVIRRRR